MDHNFKRYFGQNFLTSDEELIKFVSHIAPKENDLIIEIGPGEGVLTHFLAKSNAKVICIEIDKDLLPTLKSTFEKYPNVEIQNSDFLQLDLKELLNETNIKDTKCLKIVGSLPYNISKKIIKKCLEEIVGMKYELVFLLQKEVAEDYAENPPRASFLSNYIKLFGKCTYCMTISKDFFYPVPKVDGGVGGTFLSAGVGVSLGLSGGVAVGVGVDNTTGVGVAVAVFVGAGATTQLSTSINSTIAKLPSGFFRTARKKL